MGNNNVTGINAVRAQKAEDNSKWSPLECLEEMARKIRNGEKNPSRLVIITETPVNSEGVTIQSSSANTTFSAELFMLNMSVSVLMDEIRGK